MPNKKTAGRGAARKTGSAKKPTAPKRATKLKAADKKCPPGCTDECCAEDNFTNAKDYFKKISGELSEKVSELKDKYENLDQNTKKKIMAGVAGAVALLAGIGMAKRAVKKARKK